MPIVFAHGVAVRDGPEYRRLESVRDGFFRSSLGLSNILNPYWGGNASTFAWNLQSVPSGGQEAFGANDLELRVMLAEVAPIAEPNGPDVLLATIRQHPEAAIDALWLCSAYAGNRAEEESDLASAGGAALALLGDAEVRTEIASLRSDGELVAFLADRLREPAVQESFGGADLLEKLSRGLVALGNAVSGVPVRAIRPALTERLGRFVGDVLAYLETRGDAAAPGPIVAIVLQALRDAAAARTDADSQLIVVAHSMGGNIVYDILTAFAPDVEVDLLLTVGSQVSLFEEMKCFRGSDKSVPNATVKRVSKPPNVGRWMNVIDGIDILGFAMEPVFAGVTDYRFLSSWEPISAHGSYFYVPSFYRRLRERIGTFGVP